MVAVTLRLRDQEITGFDCVGHAGGQPAGENIVCAAVSILTTTCVNALESVAGVVPQAIAEPGFMRVRLPANAGHDAQVILRSMQQGITDLASEYPKAVRLGFKQEFGG